MNYLGGDADKLLAAVTSGMDCIVISAVAATGAPYAFWFATSNGTTVEITCEMLDIEERFEVGRLVITFEKQQPTSNNLIFLPLEWRKILQLKRLIVEERPAWSHSDGVAVKVEAGLLFNLSQDRTWSIVVGAQPCTLAIQAPFISLVSNPQYKKIDYRSLPLVEEQV